MKCGSLNVERGIYWLEVMIFVVDRINKDVNLLLNIILGMFVYDICGWYIRVLEELFEFVMDLLENKVILISCESVLKKNRIVVVVGVVLSVVFI